ncbi:hypothetical protein [Rhodococcus sp. 24CO]|uniref:hypothetical protein n=1 Tax=Rhodococcus sp. 24CO TaxID=3117460 RepID=UPI003D348836
MPHPNSHWRASASETKRLSHEAQTHHGVAASSREELQAEFEHADKIDPDVPHAGRHERHGDDGNPVHSDNPVRGGNVSRGEEPARHVDDAPAPGQRHTPQ